MFYVAKTLEKVFLRFDYYPPMSIATKDLESFRSFVSLNEENLRAALIATRDFEFSEAGVLLQFDPSEAGKDNIYVSSYENGESRGSQSLDAEELEEFLLQILAASWAETDSE